MTEDDFSKLEAPSDTNQEPSIRRFIRELAERLPLDSEADKLLAQWIAEQPKGPRKSLK